MLEQIPTFSVPPLRCDIFDNVTLLPMVGDVMGPTYVYALGAFADKKALPQARRVTKSHEYALQLPHVKAWHTSTQEVIYGGIFHMHWGHFLIEVLQRLWYTEQCNLPIVWSGVWGVYHNPSQFKAWQKEIFQALGIHNEHIFLTEPTQFAKVHFPEPGSGINTHLHPQQADFLGYHNEQPIKGKYVYFSRAKIRGCANEEALEDILKKRGWQIVYPETLTVTQQLKALSSAEICFMIGGSAQHSLLFTHNVQTRFIIIPREHTETFNIIANSKSNNYFLFHLQKNVLFSDQRDEANDLFTLDLQTLEKILNDTQNFTTSLQNFPELFTKPDALSRESILVPSMYYAPSTPLSHARKLFYHAVFFYQHKKYRAAYKIFRHLQKKNLLEESMFFDFYNAVQQYHLGENLSITLPLEKHQRHMALLRNKISKNPQDTKNFKKLTELLLIMGDFDAALQLQEQLLQHNPEWSKPLQQMAYICNACHDLDRAIQYAEQAVAVEPHKLQRKEELADYYLKKQDYGACKKLVTGTLLKFPHWDAGYLLLATVHEQQGHLDKSLACIEKALQLAPDNLKAQEQYAHILRQRGHQKASIEILAQSLQKNPRHAERHAQNARIYEHMGNLPQAIIHARKAVEMEPRNFVCKTHLANYLRKNENYAEARELMQEALHKNPFWSEPYAQFAAIHAAEGELERAIDCARKAVAIEPFNSLRRQELEKYRLQKLQKNLPPHELALVLSQRKSSTRERIQSYIDAFYAQSYLEIGVFRGRTFLHMDAPFKVAVDPNFQFEPAHFSSEDAVFYEETSDKFFEEFPARAQALKRKYHNKDFKFDIIFLDGLHTYEQTLRDFQNSLSFSHDKTIWIIDDTIPTNAFTAIPNQEKSENLKACAGLSKEAAWFGDVFKVVFAIHDDYPQFSYCTQINNGNPQTIVWRTEHPTPRKALFGSHHPLGFARYEDFVEHAWAIHPVSDTEVLRKLFTQIDPLNHKSDDDYKKVIAPIISDNERKYASENKQLESNILEIKKELLQMTEYNKQLNDENAALKKQIKTYEQKA